MVRPTHDEIIRQLTRDLAVLQEQMERVRVVVNDVPNLTVRVAVLEQQVAEIRKGWGVWVQRLWMIFAPFVGAGVGAVVTYLLNKK